MRVLVQWSLDSIGDWEEIESADWSSTPVRAVPAGGETLGTNKGYVYALNVQGIILKGFDHYHVDHIGGDDEHVRVTCWNDDTEDHPVGTRYAIIWDFYCLFSDTAMGGAINTRQTRRIYAEDQSKFYGDNIYQWTSFSKPTTNVRHGIWVDDSDAYDTAQSQHGWRSWTEGLDASELDANGAVKTQRTGDRKGRYAFPDGTKTFYHSSTTLATGLHAAEFENELTVGTATVGIQSSTGIAPGADMVLWASTTGAGAPDSAAWPTGNYRAQLDCTTAGADVTYGLLTIGGSAGHFARVGSTLVSELETKAQVESAFAGTGLKLATTGSVSWTAGSAGDRFEIVIVAASAAAHGTQKVTLELNEADDFVDGPWVAAAITPDAIFFGMNF